VRGASSRATGDGAPSLSQRPTPPAVTRRTSHRIPRTLADDERGVAVVEFALILPVLLGIVLGIIQFGTGFNYWNDLNQMAADGARLAAVNKVPASSSKLTDYIVSQADTSDLRSKASACLKVFDGTTGAAETLAQAKVGDAVKVSVSVPYSFVNIGPLTLGPITIRGNATMRLEQVSSDTSKPGISSLGTPCS
jgi:Flp pilus assembly protein TadG